VAQVDQTGGILGQRASTPADFSHSLMPCWAARSGDAWRLSD
jgi:hypothetical protein